MRARGRVRVVAVLCEECWDRAANDFALDEGATAAPPGEPGPDDLGWIEAAVCPRCGREVRAYRTNYDRWVHLDDEELPPGEVPARFRWRLMRRYARHTEMVVETVAVRVRAVDPWLGEWVVPAHGMRCEPV
ncbi:DUF6083 domain-containing protein [Streptomyces sp. NPDC126503]|uniref:DUF6083 domain-containing protein n=1 Tax=Streptomyces sp. NPDC126503 TaxID=3155315 RepID=UPI00332A0F5A